MAKRADELPEIETELDGFEVWDRTVRAPAGQAKKVAFVSLRVGGVIGANHALGEMLGWPAAVKVMFDPHRRRLGLVPSAPEDENSFETGWRVGYYLGNFEIPCKTLFDFYGIEISESRRYHDLKVIDGVLVVDL